MDEQIVDTMAADSQQWTKLPQWDGNESEWQDYVFRTTIFVAGAKPEHRSLLAARLVSGLRGSARTAVESRPELLSKLAREDGVERLLSFLHDQVLRGSVPTLGMEFEVFCIA